MRAESQQFGATVYTTFVSSQTHQAEALRIECTLHHVLGYVESKVGDVQSARLDRPENAVVSREAGGLAEYASHVVE